ncbi:MAG: NAD(P)-dependent alcohol dehydrogenase [Candidatus Aminicenantes bacterium]|nr:NAD(P)-dependent alcohol dehydrogenase [Candidatus Aminicenantes bacterium]
MKAIVYTEYGSPEVLKLQEVEKPTPKDNEILIKIRAASVNYGDILTRNFANLRTRDFNMPALFLLPARITFGYKTPKNHILGSELAGEIEDIGKDVKKFQAGDQVFAYTGMKMQGNAEYLCMPEDGIVGIKPDNMTFEEAACVPYGGIMSLSHLRKVNIEEGQKVLINGASGGIGSMAVQLCKNFGAEVTGVCGTPRLEYVKALGADKVIDYTHEDFTQNGEKYNLIYDILGRSTFSHCKNSLTENGCYLLASFKMAKVLQMMGTSISGKKKVICAMASEKQEDMALLKELVEAGKIKTIIDKTYPLEQASEAHSYVEKGFKKGHIVLTI